MGHNFLPFGQLTQNQVKIYSRKESNWVESSQIGRLDPVPPQPTSCHAFLVTYTNEKMALAMSS